MPNWGEGKKTNDNFSIYGVGLDVYKRQTYTCSIVVLNCPKIDGATMATTCSPLRMRCNTSNVCDISKMAPKDVYKRQPYVGVWIETCKLLDMLGYGSEIGRAHV